AVMSRIAFGALFALGALLALGLGEQAASAHDERPTRALDGGGSVPTYRTQGPALLVCKTDKSDFDRRTAGFSAELKAANEVRWAECQKSGYRDLQAAVDAAVVPGTNIKVLPGLYREEPSLLPPSANCAQLAGLRKSALYQYDVLTLQQQTDCPHNQNLVA